MSNLANSLQSSLEQFVKPHAVKASFPIDRLINRLGFMTVIVQSVAILAASFAAQSKVTCALEGVVSANSTAAAAESAAGRSDGHAYAESYCYSRGVDQTDLPDGTIPASFTGVLHHYMLQFYLPILFLIQAGSVYLPYYVWSQTAGECLRENVQFVVELSKKLLADDADSGAEGGHEHTDSCRHKRMQSGRPSKADLLTDEALKRRLRRWYCKSKHASQYYMFQLVRLTVLLAWVSLYAFCPGFRHSDIRYQFVCLLDGGRLLGQRRYSCVLLQASLYEVGWSTNMSILAFCLLGAGRQILYFFPCVVGCRCRQCRTKRCLRTCGKECRSHYFQRILGLVERPKRDAAPTGGLADEGTVLLLLEDVEDGGRSCRWLTLCWPGASEVTKDDDGFKGPGELGLEDGSTDYYSHRLADRYFISQLCYENSHLLEAFIPDMAGANAIDEFSSLGNLASIAMKLDRRSEQLRGELAASADAVEEKAKVAVAKCFGKKATEVAAQAATAVTVTAVAEANAAGAD